MNIRKQNSNIFRVFNFRKYALYHIYQSCMPTLDFLHLARYFI